MTGRIIIGVVGMPGSGKSIFSDVAKSFDFSVVTMGDVVREEAVRQGLEPTPENIGKLMVRLREEGGVAVVARRCIPKIREKGDKVVVDGIRSLVEVEEFRKAFPEFKLVHVHASLDTRFMRITKRNRSDDSQDRLTFVERDRRELEVGIGSAIAMADYVLTNDGTISQFKAKARRLLETTLRWIA